MILCGSGISLFLLLMPGCHNQSAPLPLKEVGTSADVTYVERADVVYAMLMLHDLKISRINQLLAELHIGERFGTTVSAVVLLPSADHLVVKIMRYPVDVLAPGSDVLYSVTIDPAVMKITSVTPGE
jgi:hypothetical protein